MLLNCGEEQALLFSFQLCDLQREGVVSDFLLLLLFVCDVYSFLIIKLVLGEIF